MSYENGLPRGYFELNERGKAHLSELCKVHGLNYDQELKIIDEGFYYTSAKGWREILNSGTFTLTFNKDMTSTVLSERYLLETFYTYELKRVREYKLNKTGIKHLHDFCRRHILDFTMSKNMIELYAKKYDVFKCNGLTWQDEQFSKKEFY